MANTYLVVDIETIPDNTLWTPPAPEVEKIKLEKAPTKDQNAFLDEVLQYLDNNRPVHKDDLEKAADIASRAGKAQEVTRLLQLIPETIEKPPFAPLHAHIPIAIGCVWLDANLNAKKVGCMKIGEGGERRLLQEWNDFMNTNRPTIVTWYGRGFDLPVLMLRSFRHGIPMGWYFGEKDYRYRYSENRNCDLCDVMSDFGASRNLKLDAIAQLIGLPGKHDDVDGSQVEGMYREGKLDQIVTYCTDDTLQTAFIFQRWQYMKNLITLENYRKATVSLLDAFAEKEELESLRKLIRRPELLLEGA